MRNTSNKPRRSWTFFFFFGPEKDLLQAEQGEQVAWKYRDNVTFFKKMEK